MPDHPEHICSRCKMLFKGVTKLCSECDWLEYLRQVEEEDDTLF